ncbi:DUF6894 family protein [Sphingomonas sp. XXL09]|uniref:DUF6894 family protein n=1 Tax=Sphingomonas sp. XXL09 TaxID=3457787 RepID=UPI00406BB198
MPKYHFNVFNPAAQMDHDGIELSSLSEARREATILAGATLKEAADVWALSDWRVEVADHHGLVLLRLDLVATISPAAEGAS